MGKVMHLAKVSPAPPSAARGKLAERIAELEAAQKAHDNLTAALDWDGSAAVALRAVREALDAAREGVENARQSMADSLVGAVTGDVAVARPNLKAAREVVSFAEDDLAAASAAMQTLQARLEPAADALRWAKMSVDDAVNAVLREHIAPNVEALFSEIDSLYRQAAQKSLLLDWLLPSILPKNGPAAHPRTIEISCLFTTLPYQRASAQPQRSPMLAKWNAAREALKTDAYAKLPEDFDP